ncbi:MAG: CoA pyrophosphatase [Gemmatimonadales bacterium]|nr:MAG: CoA pyrophosphatase [Gemmatimonadales bacterium]
MSALSANLATLRPALSPYRGAEHDPEPREGGWVAAVAVILRAPGGPVPPNLLLIRRAAHDMDPWSGHMALPGGRRDPADASLLHTARRETLEEVDIRLGPESEVLGRLDAVSPQNPGLPPLTILPIVFSVPSDTEARIAAPLEVAEVHWVPLTHFRDRANRTTYRYPGAGDLRFPAWDVAGRAVWGLTHRVLSDLLGRLGPVDGERTSG